LQLNLVHKILSIGKNNELPASSGAWRPGVKSVEKSSENKRKRELGNTASSVSCQRHPAGFFAAVRSYPFTAAVEKIPLSVGYVNKKPLYLVFSSSSKPRLSKQRKKPVQSLKSPCRLRKLSPLEVKAGWNHLLMQDADDQHPASLREIKHNVLANLKAAQAGMNRITASTE
jgi:hypothetical protein